MTDGERVRDLGEFGLIDRVHALVGRGAAVVGIGDDAAVLDVGSAEYLLATVDMLVQGVHFSDDVEPQGLGRRALAVNLSDIAAMGGTPSAALVSLALPPETEAGFVSGLYRGLGEEALRFGVAIVGGNMSATSGPVVIDITLLGRVPPDEVLLRQGAEPGDALAVSGTLGRRAARRLLHERDPTRPYPEPPEPRISLGRALAASGFVHAAIDLSDGLGSDVHHLAERSGVGALIREDQLPVSTDLPSMAADLSLDPVELALFGGEDFELLLALPTARVEKAIDLAGDVPLHVVGEVLAAEEGVVIERRDGRRELLPPRGWAHF